MSKEKTNLYPTAFESTVLAPESVIYAGTSITDQTTSITTAQPAYSFVPKTLTTTNYVIVQLVNPWFNNTTNSILNYSGGKYSDLYGRIVTNIDGYVAVESTQHIKVDPQSLLATMIVSTSTTGDTTIKNNDWITILGTSLSPAKDITILGKSNRSSLPSSYFDRSFSTITVSGTTSIAYSSLFVRDIDVSQTQANAVVLETVHATYDLMYTLSGKKFDMSAFTVNVTTLPQHNDLETRVIRLEEKTRFQNAS